MTEPVKQWWVYLVRTHQNALYCGITTDVERRFAQHSNGRGAKALKGKGPLALAWSQPVSDSKSEALKLEWRIKQLTKSQKEQLITDEGLFKILQNKVRSLSH
ncbi:GIY-YIG nuclease family protein [Vibrio porteresiae]|uniref:GIY-YIG nuclease family protein n=1 Tax=Vibrio porteresiae DSM 19223 TaxID=1123496 RepID=A0ABZ0QGJ3_9VIBR|nr:GIY-YIG nuclease family protein [Vibrio porteresiae]WPC75629.1 GIY-YIG nuclease family protein [Vibrio porteresiae DSM 19223]